MTLTSLPRRRLVALASTIVVGSLLAGCGTLSGPRQVEIPLAKLQAGLDRRFPMDNRLFDLLDLRLSHPRLSLLPETDRVAIGLEAYIAPPFMQQSFTGTLALSGRLYVDATRGAVFMSEPQVDSFTLSGIDGARQQQLAGAANKLMSKLVRDIPVYNFRMEDLRYAGIQFVPTRLVTTRTGLQVTLEPQR
ncbi:DUF1439 domain-containing protein [Massilia sp. S19_KUP03_FR1]|uniref:DUF1439 domain-containing protein n=1 Tax=Massilia sp. S19_KUP03_FR1 TaxID=3025503 RepID=UPI002FCDBFC5